MEISKKTLQRIFIGVASCILLYWLLHETERVKSVFTTLEALFAPFIIGAALAFILNVPMRGIERLLKKIPNPGARRILSIVLTLVALLLVLAFVFYMLIPQVGSTVEALVAQLPAFFKQVQDRFNEYLLEHPDIMEWVTANTDLEKLDWNTILQKAGAILGNSLTAIANGADGGGSVNGHIF